MKRSTLIHGVAIIAGIWGALALIGAWLAGEHGTIFGFTQQHCFFDAIVLELISISAGVCAIYRLQLERESSSM
jgi:hypothetical protein